MLVWKCKVWQVQPGASTARQVFHHIAVSLQAFLPQTLAAEVNEKGNLSAHTRSWASKPQRQVVHLRGRVSGGMLAERPTVNLTNYKQ
jgi:hypothetical protein